MDLFQLPGLAGALKAGRRPVDEGFSLGTCSSWLAVMTVVVMPLRAASVELRVMRPVFQRRTVAWEVGAAELSAALEATASFSFPEK